MAHPVGATPWIGKGQATLGQRHGGTQGQQEECSQHRHIWIAKKMEKFIIFNWFKKSIRVIKIFKCFSKSLIEVISLFDKLLNQGIFPSLISNKK